MRSSPTMDMRDYIYVVKEKRKNDVLVGKYDHVTVRRFAREYNADRYCKDRNGMWSDRLCDEIADLTGIKRGKGRERFHEIKQELKDKKFYVIKERLDD